MSKHKYLLAVARNSKISSIVVIKNQHVFPYTEDVMDDMRVASIDHTMDKNTFYYL